MQLVDLARLSASGRNAQPLKYYLSNTNETNQLIFPHLSWAGYLTDWPGPAEGEKPSAYIIVLGDKIISENFFCDHGLAAQSILLGAVEAGLGGCIIMSIDKVKLKHALELAEHFEILMVIAIGKPVEKVIIEPVAANGSIKYWRTPDGVHHVPKRSLDDIVLNR